jgi:hypothetical protein
MVDSLSFLVGGEQKVWDLAIMPAMRRPISVHNFSSPKPLQFAPQSNAKIAAPDPSKKTFPPLEKISTTQKSPATTPAPSDRQSGLGNCLHTAVHSFYPPFFSIQWGIY